MNSKEFFSITIAGAVGGLLTWLISQTSGGLDSNWYLTLPTGVLGGFIAAGVGVYLIANTDTSKLTRAIFFAALCGMSWQPILETGKNLVSKATINKSVADAANEIDKKVSNTTGQTASTADIQALVSSTAKVADKLPSVSDPGLQSNARMTAINAIKHLKFLVPQNPDQAVNGLQEIGRRASASGSINLKSEAIEQLRQISSEPQQGSAQAKAAEALRSLR